MDIGNSSISGTSQSQISKQDIQSFVNKSQSSYKGNEWNAPFKKSYTGYERSILKLEKNGMISGGDKLMKNILMGNKKDQVAGYQKFTEYSYKIGQEVTCMTSIIKQQVDELKNCHKFAQLDTKDTECDSNFIHKSTLDRLNQERKKHSVILDNFEKNSKHMKNYISYIKAKQKKIMIAAQHRVTDSEKLNSTDNGVGSRQSAWRSSWYSLHTVFMIERVTNTINRHNEIQHAAFNALTELNLLCKEHGKLYKTKQSSGLWGMLSKSATYLIGSSSDDTSTEINNTNEKPNQEIESSFQNASNNQIKSIQGPSLTDKILELQEELEEQKNSRRIIKSDEIAVRSDHIINNLSFKDNEKISDEVTNNHSKPKPNKSMSKGKIKDSSSQSSKPVIIDEDLALKVKYQEPIDKKNEHFQGIFGRTSHLISTFLNLEKELETGREMLNYDIYFAQYLKDVIRESHLKDPLGPAFPSISEKELRKFRLRIEHLCATLAAHQLSVSGVDYNMMRFEGLLTKLDKGIKQLEQAINELGEYAPSIFDSKEGELAYDSIMALKIMCEQLKSEEKRLKGLAFAANKQVSQLDVAWKNKGDSANFVCKTAARYTSAINCDAIVVNYLMGANSYSLNQVVNYGSDTDELSSDDYDDDGDHNISVQSDNSDVCVVESKNSKIIGISETLVNNENDDNDDNDDNNDNNDNNDNDDNKEQAV